MLGPMAAATVARQEEEGKLSSFIASQGGHFNLAQATVGVGGRGDYHHSSM